jgi:hypothetical protein
MVLPGQDRGSDPPLLRIGERLSETEPDFFLRERSSLRATLLPLLAPLAARPVEPGLLCGSQVARQVTPDVRLPAISKPALGPARSDRRNK